MLIIGLTGPAGSGKSTIAALIVAQLALQDKVAVILPMARPLKDLARTFGWDGQKNAKGRKFLQSLGTEIGRAYNRDHWTEKWNDAVNLLENVDVVVVDDVRFYNEAVAVILAGGRTYALRGRSEVATWRKWAQTLFGSMHTFVHASEMPIDRNLIYNERTNSPGDASAVAREIIDDNF